MDPREKQALWLVPLAYVVGDRALGFVVWKGIMALDAAAITPVVSFVISAAYAFAVACACVYGHSSVVGPLPVRRSFVMAAISIPMFVFAALVTSGPDNFLRYFLMVPFQATLHYAIGFFALPAAAAIMAPRQAAPMQAVSAQPVTGVAPPPPSSAGLMVLRIAVALVSVVLFLGCGGLILLVLGFSGSHLNDEDLMVIIAAVIGMVVFAYVFICALGLFRRLLKFGKVTVAVICLPFIGWTLHEGDEWVLAAIAIALFAGAFWAMCRGMEPRT